MYNSPTMEMEPKELVDNINFDLSTTKPFDLLVLWKATRYHAPTFASMVLDALVINVGFEDASKMIEKELHGE